MSIISYILCLLATLYLLVITFTSVRYYPLTLNLSIHPLIYISQPSASGITCSNLLKYSPEGVKFNEIYPFIVSVMDLEIQGFKVCKYFDVS